MARLSGKKTVGHSSSASKQLLLALVSFIFGYVSASVFDATSLSTWVNTQLLAQQTPKPGTKSAAQQAHLPPPKYEFYTLLTTEHHDAIEQPPKPAPVTTATAIQPVSNIAINTTNTKTAPVVAQQQVKTAQQPVKTIVAPPVVHVVAAKPIATHAGTVKGAYFVQVAAFKSTQEAERMKAALVMKGFSVNISVIQQKRVNWYRVNLGPYGSLALAQNAQTAVAQRAHINGMVRKLEA